MAVIKTAEGRGAMSPFVTFCHLLSPFVTFCHRYFGARGEAGIFTVFKDPFNPVFPGGGQPLILSLPDTGLIHVSA
jgi:hypothetical protein